MGEIARPTSVRNNNSKYHLMLHNEYQRKYEELQQSFAQRTLQLKREERDLRRKLTAAVDATDSFTLTKIIHSTPLPPATGKPRERSRTVPIESRKMVKLPSPPRSGRPKSVYHRRKVISLSGEIAETKSEGRRTPPGSLTCRDGVSPGAHDGTEDEVEAEKRKRYAAVSRRRNTVCPGALKVQLQKLNTREPRLLEASTTTKTKEPENIFVETKVENVGTIDELGETGRGKETEKENGNDKGSDTTKDTRKDTLMADSAVQQTPPEMNKSTVFCYVYDENNPNQVTTSKSVFTKTFDKEDSDSAVWKDEIRNDSSTGSSLQRIPEAKVNRKATKLMSPLLENDVSDEDIELESVSDFTTVTSSSASLPETSSSSSTNDSGFGGSVCSSLDETVGKPLIDAMSNVDLKVSPRSGFPPLRARTPFPRQASSLEESPRSPPAAARQRLTNRRMSLDVNMLRDSVRQFNRQSAQRKTERAVAQEVPSFAALRRRGSISDPSFQTINMEGVDVGRERFKSIAKRMLALQRGKQLVNDDDDAPNIAAANTEWKDLDKCRYLRNYVPKWDKSGDVSS